MEFGTRIFAGYCIFVLVCCDITVFCCMPSGGGGLRPRRHRDEPPLVYKQYVPNVQELSAVASGNLQGRIRPNSAREQDLLINNNYDIIFKDEEGNGEDRKMTVRCHEKLDLLSMLVKSAWKRRIKLRVIEAWDTTGIHAFDSLHYEGRALDITTSDRDREKLGMLSRLAVQAGFDWVYYETRSKVHVSCKSDNYHGRKRALKCFAEDTTVQLESGRVKKMSQIQIGDRILSMNSLGEAVYSPVILFLDAQPKQQPTEFVRIHFDNQQVQESSANSILLTPYHLIYSSANASDNPWRFAETVRSGDRLLAVSGSRITTDVAVTCVEKVILKQGYFSPLTGEGNLVVNGVLASCYAATDSHQLANWAMAPARFWHWLGFEQPADHLDYGIHWYPQLLLRVAHIAEYFGVRVLI